MSGDSQFLLDRRTVYQFFDKKRNKINDKNCNALIHSIEIHCSVTICCECKRSLVASSLSLIPLLEPFKMSETAL